MKRLLVIGTGLMGGSVARAARSASLFDEYLGLDHDADAAAEALELGIVDRLTEEIVSATAVCVAVPTRYLAATLANVLQQVPPSTAVFDVGSVKAPVIRELEALQGVAPNYVPCHPIAGSEKGGPRAARPDLFRGCSVIMTPTDGVSVDQVERVAGWWRAMGAEVSQRGADEHDRMVGLTSHLPHLLAFALMDVVAGFEPSEVGKHAGGGFRDFTRIAGSNPRVWTDILRHNRIEMRHHLSSLQASLEALQALIDGADPDALEAKLEDIRAVRDRLSHG